MKSNNYHTTEFVGVVDMTKNLRMKCPSCGHWNRVPVNEIFIVQNYFSNSFVMKSSIHFIICSDSFLVGIIS